VDTTSFGADLTRLGTALERVASWVRRATPRGEYDMVAMSTLDLVATEGPMPVSALAVRESISQPGMTGVVARLVEAGLVTRRTDPSDRRVALVAVTRAGQAHLRARHAARASVLADQIGRLTAEQQQALLAAVDGMSALTARPRRPDLTTDPKGSPA